MKKTINKREQLKQARTVKGLSRFQLANIVGCTEEHIKSLEYGRVNPSAPMMFKICKSLDKKPEELFFDIIS